MRIDRVERPVGERRALGVPLEDAAGQLANLQVTARQANGRGRGIHAGDAGAGAGELDQVHAGSAANLQHALAAPRGRPHDVAQIRHLLVAIALELFEKFRGTDRRVDDLDVVDMRRPVALDIPECGR